MPSQISGTVTRKSNGSIEITPSDAVTFKKLPEMGDEVTIDVEVTRTVAEVEKAAKTHRAARHTAASEPEPAPKKKP